jgi:hypothetical protein
MKVKELIEELKLHDPENECWLDVPYDEEENEWIRIKKVYTTGLFSSNKTIMRTYIEG